MRVQCSLSVGKVHQKLCSPPKSDTYSDTIPMVVQQLCIVSTSESRFTQSCVHARCKIRNTPSESYLCHAIP